jgi:hypothetical protein
MKKLLILSTLIVWVLSGCAMARHKQQICDGLITTGLNRNAFLQVWGRPERTESISSEEFLRAGWSGYSGGVFKGKKSLDLWEYRRIAIKLVFDDIVLVGWHTDKTVQELKMKGTCK